MIHFCFSSYFLSQDMCLVYVVYFVKFVDKVQNNEINCNAGILQFNEVSSVSANGKTVCLMCDYD